MYGIRSIDAANADTTACPAPGRRRMMGIQSSVDALEGRRRLSGLDQLVCAPRASGHSRYRSMASERFFCRRCFERDISW